ncbi:MAG: ABC transporter ATP-binding protein [Gammaproteobacteria bacterium]|jgi:putative ABC transport system ATP-binding protein|nr:ABC transporter ATP-binding protein [Gammaproteobacteria bacterium]|tara:strand:+ start:536 stop:1219 length:684 start_codon:yes stop_codon:yes gene_type:complete
MPMIQVRDVSKKYRKGSTDVEALHSVSLVIEEGESVALMGPSGSGKTTLLNLMAGIDRPTEGQVIIGGEDISAMSSRRLTRWRTNNIGYIFQLYHLIPVLTAYENVELPLTLLRMNRKERHDRVMVALRAVNMEDRIDHFPRQLSGGQEQRVAIARAIVGDPSVIIADEPTGDLDRKSAGEVMGLLKKLNKDFGKTMLIVTHDRNIANQAGRVIHLEKGIIVDGATA